MTTTRYTRAQAARALPAGARVRLLEDGWYLGHTLVIPASREEAEVHELGAVLRLTADPLFARRRFRFEPVAAPGLLRRDAPVAAALLLALPVAAGLAWCLL